MASTTSVLPHARLPLRPLQSCLLRQYNPLHDSLLKQVLIPQDTYLSLQWWASPLHLDSGRLFKSPPISRVVATDASTIGWGAHCDSAYIHGTWNEMEKRLHINYLELLAIFKALRAFEPLITNQTIQIVTDNTTALYYLNKQNGTRSRRLLNLTLELWDWCCIRNITPQAIHIASTDNHMADVLSRRTYNNHKWSLLHSIFVDLCNVWGTPSIDLFASQFNKKCPLYCSRAGQGPGSLGDAFSLKWPQNLLYAFPPIPLIQKTIIKLQESPTTLILIAPWWPRQPWFATLLSLASNYRKLPLRPHLLSQSNGSILHPDLQSLHLTAWLVHSH
ncbi:hypothetical protein JRQ81_019992 [Phrynocephalus forsythii]|uniref:Reverse transcriptase RNase H-like domain-containing protein n=1 Tax=Phrynocephalus forsythii TaxID=171643 RepID=A0A9Q1AZ30_9SAUR|nr:hypothetical protein JRQ81_019992 [Phrynocephalus forsythii]